MASDLFNSIVNLQENNVKTNLKELIKSRKIPADEILNEIQSGLIEVGKRYETGKAFLPDLIFAGQIVKDCMHILYPLLKKETLGLKGTVIIGTVYGDIHDLGKDIVVTILRGSGFSVVDLGVNVSPNKFVEAIRNNNAKLLGLSCLLTIAFESISKTVEALKSTGLRDKVKIMIGGAPITNYVKEKTGCDFYGKNAFDAVKIASKVYSE